MTMRCLNWVLAALIWAGPAWAFEWERVSPAGQGMDPEKLASLTTRLASGELGQVDGMMIVRGGQEVYREHFRGYAGQVLPVFSVTKSVGSILMGTLVRDGTLDVGDPINDYFPQYPQLRLDPWRSAITVEHILQMRHGYDWDEWPYDAPGNPLGVMIHSPDWFRTVLTWPMAGPPGTRFNYSTGASGLMSGIIHHSTGMTTQAYARQALFEPLGIDQVHWAITHLNQRDSWLDGDDFPDGIAPLGFSLWLALPDLARIGQLMLNGGTWEGQRIIDKAWIEASVRPYSTTLTDPESFSPLPGLGYGYQWWIQPFTDALGRTFDMYFASGSGRQYILVLPQADLVVVQLAADFTRTGPGIGTALREHILPAIEADPREFEPLTSMLAGSWYDPDAPGQGLNLEVLEDRGEALVYWYSYGPDGTQQWLVGQGPIDAAGVAQLDFVITRGGRLGLAEEPVVEGWGTGELSFETCSAGRLLFDSETAGVAGEIPLRRLTGVERCDTARRSMLLR